MKILVSNDDGINAKGIRVLAESLSRISEVSVVAPLTEQSAVGHAITMKLPLRVTKHYINEEFFGYAVTGTPADCVKMGIRNILPTPPDIVVSGINHGGNAAINIIYSGTVSAAREAAIMSIPAIAFSITSHTPHYFEAASKIAAELVKKVLGNKLPMGSCLNVNIPDVPASEIKGIKITRQGNSSWNDVYEERSDPYGNPYYWLTGNMMLSDNTEDTDEYAIKNNYISISPIHFDLTDYQLLKDIKDWESQIFI